MAPDNTPSFLIFDDEGIGPRIAEARKLCGLTQQGLALLVPCSTSLVTAVERGARSATPAFVAGVARALHVDVAELLGQPYRGHTPRSDQIHAAIPEIRIALNYWDVPPDVEVASRPVEAIRTDIDAISRLLDRVDYRSLSERLPSLVEELSAAWHTSTGDERRLAAELLMYAYIAVKSLAYRLGYVDLVSVAVERATWAAHETDNPELYAFVGEERCQTFFATGAYDSGLKFVDKTQRKYGAVLIESNSGLAIVGSMHLRSAIMAARNTKRRTDAWDYLTQASEVAARIGSDTNHYGLMFGPTNVKIHEIATAIELEDADEAIRRSEGFTPANSVPPERSSHHYIDLSRAQLQVGKKHQALASLVKADRLAGQHTRNHPMARETVTGLLRANRKLPEQLRSLARKMGLAAG